MGTVWHSAQGTCGAGVVPGVVIPLLTLSLRPRNAGYLHQSNRSKSASRGWKGREGKGNAKIISMSPRLVFDRFSARKLSQQQKQ